jgi:hypothetical protein
MPILINTFQLPGAVLGQIHIFGDLTIASKSSKTM